MPAFSYIAIKPSGKKIKGVTQADSQRHARQIIRELGLTPYSIDIAGEGLKQGPRTAVFNKKSLSSSELAIVTRQLGTMIQAGLPLEEALMASSLNTEQNKIKELLAAVRAKVMEGETLANALGEFPKAFPFMFRSTIAAGEKSGELGLILNRLADHTEASAEFKQRVGLALIYPVLLCVMSILIVSGLMIYIVPDIIQVFVDSGQELPALTLGLMNLSAALERYGVWILLVIALAIVALTHLLRTPALRLKLDKIALIIPVVKKFTRSYNAVRYFSTLHILSYAGVPLVEAMEISAEVIPNAFLRNQFNQATTRVKEGVALSIALKNIKFVPPIFVHMIASGEASGELDQMLERSSQSQEKELQRWVTVLVGLFEPATLIIMGGVVMLIVLAILLPILNMNQLVV